MANAAAAKAPPKPLSAEMAQRIDLGQNLGLNEPRQGA